MLLVVIAAASALVAVDVLDLLNRPRPRPRSGYVW
jgi:hypothetical protein